MSRDNSYTCIRYVFCSLNFLLWVTGSSLLGAGIWLRINYGGYATLLPEYPFLSGDILAIIIGTISFILAFCGCCGSWFQSRWMLITYFSLIVVMFVAEFSMGSVVFVFREHLKHTLKDELQNGLKHHYNVTDHGPNSLQQTWYDIQTEFQCCGVENYKDWFMIDAWKTEKWVPYSCCLPEVLFSVEDIPCGHNNNPATWHPTGCFNQVHMWFAQRLHIIEVVALGVAFVQLFGLITSMLLYSTIKRKRNSYTYDSLKPIS